MCQHGKGFLPFLPVKAMALPPCCLVLTLAPSQPRPSWDCISNTMLLHNKVLSCLYTIFFSPCQMKKKSGLSKETLYLELLQRENLGPQDLQASQRLVKRVFLLWRRANKAPKNWMWGSEMKRWHDEIFYPEVSVFFWKGP